MKKTRIIFLCTGNSARSQMAEAFLRKLAGDYFEVYSAGFEPQPINPLVYKVMDELGYDLSGQYPKALDQYLGQVHFGIIITVCAKAEKKCPTFPGVSNRLFWDLEDPAAIEGTEGEKLSKFREVRDKIKNRLMNFLKERNIPINKQTYN
ncbi:MAG: arsenate reductase ArsC [Promethearchaeota archaeon]